MDDFSDFMFDEPNTAPEPIDEELSVQAEFQLYLDDRSTAGNPLAFWEANKDKFKRLARVSRQTLCAPGATAGVERAFSISGVILSCRRLRTSDDNFEAQLFCNINREFIGAGRKKRKASDMNT